MIASFELSETFANKTLCPKIKGQDTNFPHFSTTQMEASHLNTLGKLPLWATLKEGYKVFIKEVLPSLFVCVCYRHLTF